MNRKMTVKDLAEHYQVTRQTIHNWLQHGLPHVKVGRVLRFDIEEVDRWVQEQSQKTKEEE